MTNLKRINKQNFQALYRYYDQNCKRCTAHQNALIINTELFSNNKKNYKVQLLKTCDNLTKNLLFTKS